MEQDIDILIVEDDLDYGNILETYLNNVMYPTTHIVYTSSGTEALALLKTGRVKVLLTDLKLHDPEGNDGEALIQYLHEEATVKTYIVVLSGSRKLSTGMTSLVYCYLHKPSDLDKVACKVRSALHLSLEDTQVIREIKEVRKVINEVHTAVLSLLGSHSSA